MWYENKVVTVGPEVNSISINEYEVGEIVLELIWDSWVERIIVK
jgi:hypothetical protein